MIFINAALSKQVVPTCRSFSCCPPSTYSATEILNHLHIDMKNQKFQALWPGIGVSDVFTNMDFPTQKILKANDLERVLIGFSELKTMLRTF